MVEDENDGDHVGANSVAGDCAEIQSSEIEPETNENEDIYEPKPGMIFNLDKEVEVFYKNFARQNGFSIKKRTSKRGDDGRIISFVLACAREGKEKSMPSKYFKVAKTIKNRCPARVNVVLGKDGKWHVTTVHLMHNHQLSPSKARHFRINKEIDMYSKRRLDLNDEAGIRVNKNFQSILLEAGGHENLTFSERDCRNYLQKERRWKIKDGDGETLRQYFVRMQDLNENFYYVLDLDNELRVKNIFWADARTREAYKAFGDVVTFDTTYLTNKYDMPFALFVGVNHHGQSILLGCGLLSYEDTDSFVWLFKTWLQCMSGIPPKAIITDQCKAIQNAVEMVFPTTRYRLCLWHIMKKVPEKLKSYAKYESIKLALQNVVYDSMTIAEFEDAWKQFMEKFNLYENEWLKSLYNMRNSWVSCYLKDTFWAGMSTTGRSESMNAFFDGYLQSGTSLQQFVTSYDKAMLAKVEKEMKEDFECFNSRICCISSSPIEAQFEAAYTIKKFKEVQHEFCKKVNCFVSIIKNEECNCTYSVREDISLHNGIKELEFEVKMNKESCEVMCSCRLFEFKGILCRHALSVLTQEKVKNVPQKYLLDRWRKDIRRKHSFIKCSYDTPETRPEKQRFDEMCRDFFQVAEMAMDDDRKRDVVKDYLVELREKLSNLTVENECDKRKLISIVNPQQVESQEVGGNYKFAHESQKIHSPVAVSRKGRPRTNRRMSKVEEVVNKRAKKSTQAVVKKGQYKSVEVVKVQECEKQMQTSTSSDLEIYKVDGFITPAPTRNYVACYPYLSAGTLDHQSRMIASANFTQPFLPQGGHISTLTEQILPMHHGLMFSYGEINRNVMPHTDQSSNGQ